MKLLGYYRSDFLEDVMVEGWGKVTESEMMESYLGYDPELGFIKSPEPLDAYDPLKLTVGRDLFSTQDT